LHVYFSVYFLKASKGRSGGLPFHLSFPVPDFSITFAAIMSDVIKTIRRNLALKEYDIKEKPDGKPVVFSIKFVKKNGELVFIPMATAAGLPFHAANNRMRGVRPGDSKLNQSGHIVAVDIDAIIAWNGLRVKL